MQVRRGLGLFTALLAGAWLAQGCGKSGSTAGPADPSDPKVSVVPPTPKAIVVPPAGQLYHGVLPAGVAETDSDISPANLDAYEQTVGRKVAYVYFTNNWFVSKSFPTETATWIRARGSVPFIRLMPRSQFQTTVTDPRYTLDRINAGEFDDEFAAWADGAKAFGTPVIVEYGTEINGDWFPWSAEYNGGLDVGPAKFRAAYRHVVALMRARGATNITWALHYNVQNYPEDPRNVPSSYYPGDDVVDWIGVSAYGSERPYDHRCPTFAQLLDDMLPQIEAATRAKPLFVFEFGITSNNPGCPAGPWVTAALGDLLGGRWPEIKGFAWWNEHWKNGPDPARDTIMTVQEVPTVAQAFRDALNGPNAGKVVDRPLLK